MTEKFTFIDLFAGIGGFHIAMHENGGKCVFASEIDDYARKSYKENFNNISPKIFNDKKFNIDITDDELDYNSIPDFNILCAGFPCQAFSIAGYRKGFEDDKGRGNLFFNIYEILKVKKPNAFILENVKNLKTHDKGRTYQTICSHLTSLGYGIKAGILNAKDFGLHQNRERIYIIGIKNNWYGDKIPLPTNKNLTFEKINLYLENQNYSVIKEFDFTELNKDIVKPFHELKFGRKKWIETKINGLNVKYLNPPKSLEKYFQKFEEREDWFDFIYNSKGGHFRKACAYINSKIKGEQNIDNWQNWTNDKWTDNGYSSVYQWRRKYVRKNSSGVTPTLTANMGTGGHNVPLIVCGVLENGEKLIRKLTPNECLAFQGFDKEYIEKMAKLNISKGQKYKQAGNSVPVNVVKQISDKLISILYE